MFPESGICYHLDAVLLTPANCIKALKDISQFTVNRLFVYIVCVFV